MKTPALFTLLILAFNGLYAQDSLRLHLTFDENLIDESGYSNDGTPLSDLDYFRSWCEKSVQIKNTSFNAVSVDGSVFNELQNFTISALVRLEGLNANNNLISCANAFTDNEFILGYNYLEDSFLDGWHIVINGNRYHFDNDSTINDLSWHHLIVIREGDLGTLYLDGQQIGEAIPLDDKNLNVDPNGFIIGQDQDCIGGCFQNTQSWFGLVDELKVFSKALQENELDNLICSTTNIFNHDKAGPVTIYPNPFVNVIYLNDVSGKYNFYELYSSSGTLMRKGKILPNNKIQLDEKTPSGLYFIHLYGNSASRKNPPSTHRLIKIGM